ncbi:MAG: hypothetical protein ABS75_10790 [Pelagibacterium sp. SCN 63-23]|nr:MAG: hypothetical protein ABS75_10790 [Pelagibacterium sp. SCN 63-23]
MIRDLLKWAAPGVVTVFGGTAAALAMATPHMIADLTAEGEHALRAAQLSWGRIGLDARDLSLAGTASTTVERDAAMAVLAAIPGIRAVRETVTIAPLATPYEIQVSVENGAISLSGAVPNESVLNELAALPTLAAADLVVRSGQPDEIAWRAGVDFALAQADLLESGALTLSGLTVSTRGSTNSERALGALQIALADLPEGVSLGQVAIDPVRVAPYTWTATFDGDRIAISGYAPAERVVERLRMADVSGLPIATGLSLASGAPEGFAERSRLLVEQLARLEHGEASIVDGVSRLTGAPPSIEVAQAVTEALTDTGAIVQLAPPRVADYWVSINRQPGNVLVFDGYAPDEATRQAFAAIAGADASFLKLGSGAPDSYRLAVDFGLDLLSYLAEGRFSLRGNVLSLSGFATTPTDYRTLIGLLESGVPQGLVLGQMDYRAPPAAQYGFAARRQADGAVVLSGMVPGPDLERHLLAAAGPDAVGELSYASGEPLNFTISAEQALDFLPWLDEGEVRFDGRNWIVRGLPASPIDRSAIETEFAVRGLVRSGWVLDLAEAPPAPATPAEIAPPATAPAEPEATPEPEAFAAQNEVATSAAVPVPAAEPEPITVSGPLSPPEPAPAPAAVAPAGAALCREQLAELSAHNAILFQSGAAIIAAGAAQELDAFAQALGLCPELAVNIEGHTDSDGDDQRNLALSVARAEAVVNALIERGVAPERLYAIGYGESQPVADNANADGKRQNRRIVVTLRDGL